MWRNGTRTLGQVYQTLDSCGLPRLFPLPQRCVYPTYLLDEFLISQPLQSFLFPSSPPTLTLRWFEIPQRLYENGHRQCDFRQSDPISFSVYGVPGINMGDAFRKHFTGLDDRDDPMFQTTAKTISCRFLVCFFFSILSTSSDLMSTQVPWLPGTLSSGEDHRPIHVVACSLRRQIPTLGWAKDRIPITRSKLAYEVAKQLNRYLESMVVSLLFGGYAR